MKRSLQIAWAAGLFEGEGCFTRRTRHKGDKVYYHATMGLTTTCHETINDFYYVVRCGYVLGPYKQNNILHKEYWQWYLTRPRAIDMLAGKFAPYLSETRLLRAKELGINVPIP